MSISRKFALLVTVLLCAVTLNAQVDRLYLKNGSLLKGRLIEVEKHRVTFQTDSSSILTLSTKSIATFKIRKRKTRLNIAERLIIDSLHHLPVSAHFYHRFQVGLLIGQDNNFGESITNLSFDYTLFRRLNRNSHLGLGVSSDYYTDFQLFPIFLEYRKDLGKTPSRLFFYLKAGHALARERDITGDFYSRVKGNKMTGWGIGYQWALRRNNLTLSIGSKRQDLKTSVQQVSFERTTDWKLRRVEFKLGLTF